MNKKETELRESEVERFLELIRKSRRGKFKLYIGMAAGVGKTYRMLEEAHELLEKDVDVKIGIIETHGRKETAELTEGIPRIPMKEVFYKGKELKEMDLEAIKLDKPEVILVDELAHTNVPGSKNEKRWQDVVELLKNNVNVISTVNIQHLESLNNDIKQITGVDVKERVPDTVLQMADEIVNVDLTADELLERLEDGKIYDPSKISTALENFFIKENLLQLRELALREAAGQLGRKIDAEVYEKDTITGNRIMVCISTNPEGGKHLIRRAARMASTMRAEWTVMYVQSREESSDRVDLADQRYLINNFKMATELGAEVEKKEADNIAETIVEYAKEHDVRWVMMGAPKRTIWNKLGLRTLTEKVLHLVENLNIDLIVVSHNGHEH
ncbi:two-component system, OmpR family, sensor histidine kinase KdpD [Fodinibius salinus]|uniref:Two-component system, OmpR family, sensor histidine kinase KdpD n=1 Tax=Fodinibius salinus TaxID=860790 RepID=A0A5D3YJK1_9BACT|nr:universal stress protein [Fodinibius salinus]TYP93742.1 two-component system, OmpR family, sensor histidine kinase KdpD [Fodinibius salinus]